ncbi:hypothetical protein [Serratia fonticola]|uniref:hypothetical protein n=1 Tax=Serratia fonticola TaxID=47917 RepID=UPI001C45CEA5|nr:hypothetical protein [Serratia fonticola]QXN62803.1 hypothetical protein J8M99_01620 [Serratia fonticola]
MNLFKTPFQFAKPKGMGWEMFERKRWQLFRLEEKFWQAFRPFVERMTGPLELADFEIASQPVLTHKLESDHH